MKKAATSTRKSAARRPSRKPGPPKSRWRLPHPKFVGALVGGVLLLALGGLLWKEIAGLTFDDSLLKKLPIDSSVAGVARLSETDSATLTRLSSSGKVLPTTLKPVVDTVRSADGDGQLAELALGREFAWAENSRGSLAVFKVKNGDKLRELSSRLQGSIEGVETARAGEAEVRTGTLKGTTQPISYGVSGPLLYVASNPQLIGTSVTETKGFTAAPGYAAIADRMPTAKGGYVFINTAELKSGLPQRYRMVGLSWSKEGDDLNIAARTSDDLTVQTRLPRADGRLLASVELASASVGGTDAVKFVRLLEQQRQRDELPKVLSFQKSVAGLDKALQSSALDSYLARANGDWSYSRYASPTGEQWMAVFEFPSAATAQSITDDLATRLNQRVTIPVRREVVTVLPDGTSSREVESEGRVPVTFSDVPITNGTAKAAGLPGIGQVVYLVQDKYFMVSSEPAGIDRLKQVVGAAPASGPVVGELAVRLLTDQAQGVITKTDPLLDWILATTPSSGDFTLTPDGRLTGSIEFKRVR